jgi:hypothetical protein
VTNKPVVLIGYWPLNESSGSTAYDHSGNGNHGSHIGGVGPSGTGTVNGPLGQSAYEFDENDDRIELPLKEIQLPASVTVWLYTRSSGTGGDPEGQGTIFSNFGNGGDRFSVAHSNNYEHSLSIYLNHFNETQTYDFPENEWVHLGFVVGSSSSYAYVNGKQLSWGRGGSGATYLTKADPWYIGSRAGGSRKVNGYLSELRLYNRALTPQEVKYLYTASQRGRQVTSSKSS